MKLKKIKNRLYHVFERTSKEDPLRRPFENFLLTIISLNVLVIVLESVTSLFESYRVFFLAFEVFVVLIFSIEYILRVWACTESDKYKHPFWGRLKFMRSGFAIIDLFAILPFYLPVFGIPSMKYARVSQIFRLFRLFKMGRYFEHWEVFSYVFKDKKDELKITFYILSILLILVSSIIFFIEGPVQPEKFSSIPASMWWGVITMTTVGYGDIYPITAIGKVFGSFIALMGIGLFAVPAGILGSGFVDQVILTRKKTITCPHCNKELKDPRFRKLKKQKSWFSRLFKKQ